MNSPKLKPGWRKLEPLVGIGLFGLALAALHHELRGHDLADIFRTLNALPATRVAAAIALTIGGYGFLTLYDYLAVRFAGGRLTYRTVAPASFVSCAVGHNLGMATLTSVPLRFRFYSAAGLGPAEVARVVVFVSLTFWLGVVTLGGAAFVIEPLGLPRSWGFALAHSRALGFGLLVLTSIYMATVAFYRRPIRIRSFEISLPTLRETLLQIGVASADLSAAAGVLYLLLPAGAGISFPKFLAVYLLALIAGILSQVPGGLGVFEAVVVATLPVDVPAAAVLATLLAYRIVYYVIPLFLAGGTLAVMAVRHHKERLTPVWHGARAWSAALMPHVAATVVFLGGAVLLFSGSIPGLPDRLRDLDNTMPLPVIEVSHMLGSVVGVCLLFLARGLQRRLDAAYGLTMLLLATGVVASLTKGLDYEEAVILGAVALVLLPTRAAFYRKSALLTERFTAGWFAAIAIVLAASTWLGLLAFRRVEYSGELWWRFALDGDVSRFLRATVAVAVIAVVVGMVRLVRPAGPAPTPPDHDAVERAARIVERSADCGSNLALLGDKTFLFAADGSGFLMYGVAGRSWVSMGDPVGPAATQRELAWSFRGLVDRYDAWPVFYEVRAENIPLYLDLGLTLLKLGEQAMVPLEAFTLDGSKRKDLRHAQRSAEKDGCTFSVATSTEAPALLPALRHVSDQWLESKNTKEKGFSLGFFDEAYIRRFSQALVRRNGTIVAFANIWTNGARDEMSIDLMRYSSDAPSGVMDYLLTELMLWGKAEGYRRFDLGMAPMAGMESHALAPLWSRVGAFVFGHVDDLYNFKGLRAYKNKFDPIWEPRYLASPAGFVLPRILANLATLIGGGVRGVFGK